MVWDDFDAPPVRLRGDQTGDERDVRRFHDWADVEGPPEPEKPQLRVLGPDGDPQPEPVEAPEAIPEASGGFWQKRGPEPWQFVPTPQPTPPDVVTGLRLYARQIRAALERRDGPK